MVCLARDILTTSPRLLVACCRAGRILASNRDEFLGRPSLPAHWHSFEPITHGRPPHPPVHSTTSHRAVPDGSNQSPADILSGRDSVAGGTWLGINRRTGKFGFLTNVNALLDHAAHGREQAGHSAQDRPAPASRGLIIQAFLQSDEGIQCYIDNLKSSRASQNMNGYNLVVGQIGTNGHGEDRIGFFCNRDPDRTSNIFDIINIHHPHQDASEPTLVHGISNGIASQAPVWPKVTRGIRLMEECLSRSCKGTDAQQADLAALERDLFNLLSPDTWYGTRTQTIVLVSQTTPPKITLVERDAFQILPGPDLGIPVWVGDEKSDWRRFEFEFPS